MDMIFVSKGAGLMITLEEDLLLAPIMKLSTTLGNEIFLGGLTKA